MDVVEGRENDLVFPWEKSKGLRLKQRRTQEGDAWRKEGAGTDGHIITCLLQQIPPAKSQKLPSFRKPMKTPLDSHIGFIPQDAGLVGGSLGGERERKKKEGEVN